MHRATTYYGLLLAALTLPFAAHAEPDDRPPTHEELLKRNAVTEPVGNISELAAAVCNRGKSCSSALVWKMESGSPELRTILQESFNSAYCHDASTWESMAERYPRLRVHMVSCFTAWSEADCDYYTGKRPVISLPGCREIAHLE